MKAPPAGRSDPFAGFRGQCGSCGERLLWGTTDNGERIPLNEGPSYFGNVTVYIEPGTRRKAERLRATVLKAGQLEGARLDGQKLYRSHFSDCPDARRYRRKRRKTK